MSVMASRIRATIASRKTLPLTEADLDVVDRLKTDGHYRNALARLNGQRPADLDNVSESVLLHALFQAGAAALRATEQDLGYQQLAEQYNVAVDQRKARRRVPAWADEQ